MACWPACEALKHDVRPLQRAYVPGWRERVLGWGLGVSGTVIVCAAIYYAIQAAQAVAGAASTWVLAVMALLAYTGLMAYASRHPALPLDDPHACSPPPRCAGSAPGAAKTVAIPMGRGTNGRERLRDAGVTLVQLGSELEVAQVKFGSRARKLGVEQGYKVAELKLPNPARPSAHWVFLPALLIAAGVWWAQGLRLRRALPLAEAA
jgi:hypothetical protein